MGKNCSAKQKQTADSNKDEPRFVIPECETDVPPKRHANATPEQCKPDYGNPYRRLIRFPRAHPESF